MPITQLRFFNAPLSLIMKYPLTQAPRPISTFSRLFPHKLKYHKTGLGSSSSFSNNPQLMTLRKLSTRPFKARSANRSEFNSSSRGRNEIGAASKSLIDDEAELSDWVSELRTDSFRGKLTSEDESDSERGFRSRVGGGREGLKRGRDSESFNRGGREGFKRGRESELDSGRYRNGGGSSRGGRQSSSSELSGRREGRGLFERRNFSEPVGKRRSEGSLEGRSSHAGSRGARNGTSSSSAMKRSGESRYGFDSSGSVSGRRGGLVISDEEKEDEDEEDDIGSFRQFLSEDESEDGTQKDDDEDDDGVLIGKASSSLGLRKEEDGEKALPRSAVGDNDSYLSETRYVI